MTQKENKNEGHLFLKKAIKDAEKLAKIFRELYLDDSSDAKKGFDPFGKIVSDDPNVVISSEEAESGLEFIFGPKNPDHKPMDPTEIEQSINMFVQKLERPLQEFLTDRQRQAFRLNHGLDGGGGRSVRQVAQEMRITPSSAQGLLTRGRRRLRSNLPYLQNEIRE